MEKSDDNQTERRKVMALKALMLRKRLTDTKKALDEMRAKSADFEKREAELEQAINEAETDEEKQTVEEEIEKFETEKKEHDENVSKLEDDVAAIEKDLAATEAEQPKPATVAEERGEKKTMITRKFYGMDVQERDRFFANDKLKDFLSEVRTCMKEKRALTNVGLVIPEVMLPLIKTKVEENSKLAGRVNLISIAGNARTRIMGSIPEAIWTEMVSSLNELDMKFYDDEVDGYKVGGFIPVSNAYIEDNDVDLVSAIIDALGRAIGKALDKAIVYGTGVKMPLGIVTRLAQTTKPESYSATSRPWEDLHESHIIAGTGASGINLFKEMLTNSSVIDNDYITDGLVYMMSKKTHDKIKVQSMDKNTNALIVAGMNNTMPIVGGEIVELSFIPEDNVIAGYLPAYLLSERKGVNLSQSEHVRFIQDQTVFKGTARYDGKPVIAEAFVIFTISSAAPTTSIEFPTDKAN